MKLLHVILPNPIHWSIHPTVPPLLPLSSLPGYSLVNPVLYPAIGSPTTNPSLQPGSKHTFVCTDNTHIASTELFLASPDDQLQFDSTLQQFMFWERYLIRLLDYLRYASKQPRITSKILQWGPEQLNSLPELKHPKRGELVGVSPSWAIRTAITADDVKFVNTQSFDEPPPSFDTMLMHAIALFIEADYMQAFLPAVIAMEHLAKMKLADAFEETVAKGAKRQIGRMDEHVLPDRPNIRKLTRVLLQSEPVDLKPNLDTLFRQVKFGELLHDLPMVLTGRSLLMDNEELYHEAIMLYDTRSIISHREIPFADETDLRFAGVDQASKAIRCAIQVIQWFGERSNYIHPFDRTPTTCHSAITE